MHNSKNLSEIILKLEASENPLSHKISDILSSDAGKLLDQHNTSWETFSIREKAEMLKQVQKEGITMRELVYAYKIIYMDDKNILESIDNALLDYLDYFTSLY
jgi:hypothetical protein